MAAEAGLRVVGLVLFLLSTAVVAVAANWCVARSDSSEKALQTALDYACNAGADCAPIQPDGLCFLPNTLLAHASYAFNSYYQRKNNAPDSCSFAATSAIARTDPSYGSCVYPSSPSSAGGTVLTGGTTTTTTAGTTTSTTTPPPPPTGTAPPYGSGTGLTPGNGPVIPDAPLSKASQGLLQQKVLPLITFLLGFLIVFQIM